MINLYTNYYIDKNIDRNTELNFCIERNIKNRFINNIYFLNEDDIKYDHNKIINVNIKKRPTYKDFIDFINNNSSENDISIITNLDIYFDDSIKVLENIDLNNKCFALTRYDVKPNNESRYYIIMVTLLDI